MVNFKIENKKDSRIYLAGEVDIDTIDDTDGGDWNYEQNNGLMESHIPSYWKTFGEDLTDEFHDFLNGIDWDDFQQALCDFADENRSFDCGEYILHINEGEKPNKKTTIKVSQSTKEKLDSVKIHHRETYEDVLLRLLSSQ